MSGAAFGPLWTELSPPLAAASLQVLQQVGFERAAPVQARFVCGISCLSRLIIKSPLNR